MKSISSFIFYVILIHTIGYHAHIHSAAENAALQERLLENNQEACSLDILNRQLLYATFTGDLESARQALQAGANPNALGKYDSCNNRMTQCLLSYHRDWRDPVTIAAMAFLTTSLLGSALCVADAIPPKNPNISPEFCVATTLTPALIASYFFTKLAYRYYEDIQGSCCWKRKIIYEVSGKTPLIIAAQKANSRKQVFNPLVQLLLEYKANINGTDDDGNTPLMFAITHNNPNAVKILGLAGADTQCVNIYGESALSIAPSPRRMSSNSSIHKLIHALNAVDALAQHIPIAYLVRTIIDYGIPYPDATAHAIDPEKYIPQLIDKNAPFPRMRTHTTPPRQATLFDNTSAAAIDYRALPYDVRNNGAHAIYANDGAYALAIYNGEDNNNSDNDDQKENAEGE